MTFTPLTEKNITKEALAWFIPLGIMAILGGGGGILAAIRGQQESIAKDSGQLLVHLQGMLGKYPQSSSVINDMIADATQINQLATSVMALTNIPTSSPAAAQEVANNMLQMGTLLGQIKANWVLVKQREGIISILSQRVEGLIADVEDGLSDFGKAAQVAAKHEEERQKVIQKQPTTTEQNAVPQPADVSEVSKQDKAEIISLLNRTFKSGTTEENLKFRLHELAAEISSSLGVSNLPPSRLMHASADQIQDLIALWRDPATAIGYDGPQWDQVDTSKID